jgi:hypothetical protein
VDMPITRRPALIRLDLLVTQCAWCGAFEIRGRHVRFVGAPILAFGFTWQLWSLFAIQFAVSHSMCPTCFDWRIKQDARISQLERTLAAREEPDTEE